MAEITWMPYALATAIRMAILLFMLWLLYRGLKGLTLWRWSGIGARDVFKRKHEQYRTTMDARYVCQRCGIERAGRHFYFDANGPDGHRIEQCRVCTRRQASSSDALTREGR